jgi:hypothetical protein
MITITVLDTPPSSHQRPVVLTAAATAVFTATALRPEVMP